MVSTPNVRKWILPFEYNALLIGTGIAVALLMSEIPELTVSLTNLWTAPFVIAAVINVMHGQRVHQKGRTTIDERDRHSAQKAVTLGFLTMVIAAMVHATMQVLDSNAITDEVVWITGAGVGVAVLSYISIELIQRVR